MKSKQLSKYSRDFAKRYLPKGIVVRGWSAICQLRSRKARTLFARDLDDSTWLNMSELEILQSQYPREITSPYEPDTLVKRGQERANEMLRLVDKDKENLTRFLDLGAWDGMSCVALHQMQKNAIGIDIRREGFTSLAYQKGIAMSQMDASILGFADNSFDFIFSYNSFEHFPDPELVLKEALRVVRPGGYIYLNFGPLYHSARGAHLYKVITVPYCQFLFTKELLTEFTNTQSLALAKFSWMNEWSLEDYRNLWQKYASQIESVVYYEIQNADHLDLIARYPSCFRGKVKNFDELLVSNIECLFRKVI